MKRHRNQPRNRRGTSAVEFAMIVPVMLIFTFGLIEMSRISMVKEAVIQASREGARVGVRPNATIGDVNDRINSELAIMNLSAAAVTVNPSTLDTAMPGDEISVRITIPISDVSYVPGFFTFNSDIIAETVMRRESTG